jgi:predicted nucleotide-binding protein (sugar kinase/HSP70/actin superfamily)
LEKALSAAGFANVPLISLKVPKPGEKAGLKLTPPLIRKVLMAMIYGDLLMQTLYHTRPYETLPGTTDRLFAKWMERAGESFHRASRKEFKENLADIVTEFDRIPTTGGKKSKVGLVGEILVKYHPAANNNMAEFIEEAGAEMVVPGLLDFFLYCALGSELDHRYLAGGNASRMIANSLIRYAEDFRNDLRQALSLSHKFRPPETIYGMAEKAKPLLSLCNHSGEGWLLTAEMAELIEAGANNIICMQPFACLPNHITGKGMIKPLKERYPGANIVTIDYDPGASAVNQINRIRLMLERAAEVSGPWGNRES